MRRMKQSCNFFAETWTPCDGSLDLWFACLLLSHFTGIGMSGEHGAFMRSYLATYTSHRVTWASLASINASLAPQEADSRRLLPLKLRVNFNSVLFTKERVDELLAQVVHLRAALLLCLIYCRPCSKKSPDRSWGSCCDLV